MALAVIHAQLLQSGMSTNRSPIALCTSACLMGLVSRYCFNGMCRMNRLSAAYSNLKGCAAPTSAACKEVVTYNGVCGYTDASFGLTGERVSWLR